MRSVREGACLSKSVDGDLCVGDGSVLLGVDALGKVSAADLRRDTSAGNVASSRLS